MALPHKGLGRGLGALFQDEGEIIKGGMENARLSIKDIAPNPEQPRRDFKPDSLKDLAESIRNQGILQPILVRRLAGDALKYEIVAGERRWRAAKLAGLEEVPVLIKGFSDKEALAVALVENLQREDLNPLEESLGLSQLKEKFSLSQEEMSRILGKSRSAIANSLRLLQLSPAAKQALKEGKISAGHARSLLAVKSADEQEALLARISSDKLNVRESEGLAALQKDSAMDATPARDEIPATEREHGAEYTPSDRVRLPQSSVLLGLQSKVAECFQLPVKISGGEGKGKVSISYASKKELSSLLSKIGLSVEF